MARLVCVALIVAIMALVMAVDCQERVFRRRGGFGRRFGFACCSAGEPGDRLGRPGELGNNRFKRAVAQHCCTSQQQAKRRQQNGGNGMQVGSGAARGNMGGNVGTTSPASGTGGGGSMGSTSPGISPSNAGGSAGGGDSSPEIGAPRGFTGRRIQPLERPLVNRKLLKYKRRRPLYVTSSSSSLGSSHGSGGGKRFKNRGLGQMFARNEQVPVRTGQNSQTGSSSSENARGAGLSSPGSAAGYNQGTSGQGQQDSQEASSQRQMLRPRGQVGRAPSSSGSAGGSVGTSGNPDLRGTRFRGRQGSSLSSEENQPRNVARGQINSNPSGNGGSGAGSSGNSDEQKQRFNYRKNYRPRYRARGQGTGLGGSAQGSRGSVSPKSSYGRRGSLRNSARQPVQAGLDSGESDWSQTGAARQVDTSAQRSKLAGGRGFSQYSANNFAQAGNVQQTSESEECSKSKNRALNQVPSQGSSIGASRGFYQNSPNQWIRPGQVQQPSGSGESFWPQNGGSGQARNFPDGRNTGGFSASRVAQASQFDDGQSGESSGFNTNSRSNSLGVNGGFSGNFVNNRANVGQLQQGWNVGEDSSFSRGQDTWQGRFSGSQGSIQDNLGDAAGDSREQGSNLRINIPLRDSDDVDQPDVGVSRERPIKTYGPPAPYSQKRANQASIVPYGPSQQPTKAPSRPKPVSYVYFSREF